MNGFVETLAYGVRVFTFCLAAFCTGVLAIATIPFVRFVVRVKRRERKFPAIMGMIGIAGVTVVFVDEMVEGLSRLHNPLIVPEDWVLLGGYAAVTVSLVVLLNVVRQMAGTVDDFVNGTNGDPKR